MFICESYNLSESKLRNVILFIILSTISFSGCQNKSINAQSEIKKETVMNIKMDNLQKATFGSGCFWCSEAIFKRLGGVVKVESGYSGGNSKNPTYEEVCTGTTGHAEVIQITYDSAVISYDELLEVFWKTHDPTTLNRQGNDVGTQYRSVVFYHNEEQKQLAEKYKEQLDKSGAWITPIVTEISPLINYFPAEKYHQDYYNNNPNQGYCTFVIAPKLAKFEKVFHNRLKSNK